MSGWRSEINQQIVVGRSKYTVPKIVITAAATYTGLTYEDNAGKVRLLSAGAHGLTTAIAITGGPAMVYVTWSGGTGVSGLYPILALDVDTVGTKVTIDLAYVVGLGTPVVTKANTSMVVETINVPALLANSSLDMRATIGGIVAGGSKTFNFRQGATSVGQVTSSVNIAMRINAMGFCMNSNNSQVWTVVAPPGGGSATAVAVTTTDMSVATQLTLNATLAVHNEVAKIYSYYVGLTL